MKFSRFSRSSALRVAIAAVAGSVVLASWATVLLAASADERQQLRQANSHAAILASAFEAQIYRQILSIEQVLSGLRDTYERGASVADSTVLVHRAAPVSDIAGEIMLTGAQGHVVLATRPALLGTDLSGRPFFVAQRDRKDVGALVSGPYQTDGAWRLTISRRLDNPYGAFLGIAAAEYELGPLARDMAQTDLASRGMIMLLGQDGQVRALALAGAKQPGADIAGSPLYRAVFPGGPVAQSARPAGTWSGALEPDGPVRLHAWRRIPGQGMVLIVGLDRAASLAGAEARRHYAVAGASILTLLVLLIAAGASWTVSTTAARVRRMTHDRKVLEATNQHLARARELADETSLQLGMTLAGMSDGISMVDGELRLLQWNAQFAALVRLPDGLLRRGLPLAEILRSAAWAREGVTDEAVERDVATQLAQARAGTWPAINTEHRPDGTALELRRSQLPDGGWVTLYSDVTARKQAEAAQCAAREQAELAAQEKSQFLAIVSHEIRTPLNVTINSLALLDGTALGPAQRRWVQTGLLAGESLLGLLNDILDLSRLQVGRLHLQAAPFQLRPLLNDVAAMFRQQALERGVRLGVMVAPGVPDALMTDAGRLRQALTNLVSNAAKFAEPGPATLRVGFTTVGGARTLRIAMRDAGPDIAEADRARLFRPFSQLTPVGSSGTGLGLAICQLLVTLLGGQIGCDHVPAGKEFWLTLPPEVMDIPSTAAAPAAARPPDWLPRTRVLLVEDMPANQLVAAYLLRREGHMVDIASSGEEALAMAARRPYDIAFLDIFMPGIDGLETARRLRRLEGPNGHIPLVALTANLSGLDQAQCMAAGLDDLMAKPLQRTALLAAIARHVWPGRRMAGQPPCPAARPEDMPIDVEQVESWRKGLKPDVSEALVTDCVRQLNDMAEGLRAAVSSGEHAEIRRLTHNMEGVAGNYGFQRVRATAHALAQDPPRPAAADAMLETLRAEITLAEGAVSRLHPAV